MPHTDFNLVTEAWIPVRYLSDGRNCLISLDTLFTEAEQIHDLDCPAHERIALMRLLICITQAAIGAPETDQDWNDFGNDLASQVDTYLHRSDILPHFNLFGDGPRFLQDASLEQIKKHETHTSWIVFHMATNNNYTLFDHAGGTPREIDPATLARALLAFQNFSPPLGRHTAYGHCSENNALHTVLLGSNLKKTIHLNCIDQETINAFFKGGIGKPIWEQPNDARKTSYLGRLVPLHRPIWFKDLTCLYKHQTGVPYPLFKEAQIREASQTLMAGKKGPYLLKCSLAKGVWRDLHAFSVDKQATDDLGPMTISSHFYELNNLQFFPIFAGGLIFENTASLVSALESNLTIPSRIFEESGREAFVAGINYAEFNLGTPKAYGLRGAIKNYAKVLDLKPTGLDSLATTRFWHALEQQVGTLLEIVRDDSVLAGKSFGEGDDPWTVAVHIAARDAYERTCPRQTPRQLQAYAAGLRSLRPKIRKSKQPKGTASND